MIRRALSIRQPWAWLITHGYKDVENRSWRSSFRGQIYIHAAVGMTRMEYEGAKLFALSINHAIPFPSLAQFKAERGGIVGTALVVDCVSDSSSRWFVGTYGLVMSEPTALPQMVPSAGQLGFYFLDVQTRHSLENLDESFRNA